MAGRAGADETFEIDLKTYKDGRAARVPKGDYLVTVDEITRSFAKETNNLMYTMWLEIAEGPWKGSRILDRLVMTDNSKWRAVAFAQATGILPTGVPLAGRAPVKMPFTAVKGRRLLVSVADGEEWQGRIKSEVKDYMKPGSTGAATADEPDVDTEPEDLPDDPEATQEEAEEQEAAEEQAPPPPPKAAAKKAALAKKVAPAPAPESEPEDEGPVDQSGVEVDDVDDL
jgi:hypothetical protein